MRAHKNEKGFRCPHKTKLDCICGYERLGSDGYFVIRRKNGSLISIVPVTIKSQVVFIRSFEKVQNDLFLTAYQKDIADN